LRELKKEDIPAHLQQYFVESPDDLVTHPTVKPVDLMRWLIRLVTPADGVVLEPFAGSGTTVEACLREGRRCIAVEREADYLLLIQQRVRRLNDPVGYLAAGGDDLGLLGELYDDRINREAG
jgi:DNA modification methylase